MGLNSADAIALEAVVKKYTPEFVRNLHFGNPSAAPDVARTYEDNKGVIVVNKYRVIGDTVFNYNSVFQDRETAKLSPILIENHRVKQEFSADPGEMENDYSGFMRASGQNPADNPLFKMMIDEHIAKFSEELEVADWQGERIAAPTIGTPLISCKDGWRESIRAALALGDFVPTITGAITETNILASVRTMYDKLHPALKESPVTCYMSINHRQSYRLATIDYAKFTRDEFTSLKFATADNMTMKFLPGMPDNAIIITYKDNMARTVDKGSDRQNILTDSTMYTQQYGIVMRTGNKVLQANDNHALVNDGWL